MNDVGKKNSLIYKEKGDIFNLPMCVALFIFCEETLFRQYKDIGSLSHLGGGTSAKNKQVFTYLFGGVNAYKF